MRIRIRLDNPSGATNFVTEPRFHSLHGFRWFLNFAVRIDKRRAIIGLRVPEMARIVALRGARIDLAKVVF